MRRHFVCSLVDAATADVWGALETANKVCNEYRVFDVRELEDGLAVDFLGGRPPNKPEREQLQSYVLGYVDGLQRDDLLRIPPDDTPLALGE